MFVHASNSLKSLMNTQHQDADWVRMDEAVGSCIVTVALMALRKVSLMFVSLMDCGFQAGIL